LETKTKQLKKDLLTWYTNNKRSFSWRNTNDPWKILLIEIISQQTQINRADTYYQKFIKRFPTPESMSTSSLKTILKMWSGLGYNNRAKRLYESSKLLAEQGFEGIYPNFEILPGVGPYTKNAILSFAYGDNVLAVDTNLQRIIIRYFGIDNTKDYVKEYSNLLLKDINSKDLNQAFMDFGSSICTSSNAKCDICPLEKNCKKYFLNSKNSNNKFKGSNRELRGKIVRLLLEENEISIKEVEKKIGEDLSKIITAITSLNNDGLLKIRKNNIIEINSN
jgi:A/G-specific adenine glycosylase